MKLNLVQLLAMLISLSQLIQNMLYVVLPYSDHKKLLQTILRSRESMQSWSIRKEAMHTLRPLAQAALSCCILS